MHEPCISCLKVGVSCRGPRLTDMTIAEAISLMKARKKFLGWSNQQLADRANKTPKGTIDGIFAATHADFRYETIRPVWNALFSGDASGNPCPDVSDDERSKYEERIRQLEKDVSWHEDKITQLTHQKDDLLKQKEAMQTLITNTNKRHDDTKKSYEEELAFLRKEIKRKNKFVTTLAIIAIVALLYIIVMLIIDRLDPTKGYYWLESLMKPHGITEILQRWRS